MPNSSLCIPAQIIVFVLCFLVSIVLHSSVLDDFRNVGTKIDTPNAAIKPSQFAFIRLETWLQNGGAHTSGVEIQETGAGGGHGLFTTKEVSQNSKLFSIPQSLWLSDTNARHRSQIKDILDSEPMVLQLIQQEPQNSWGLVLLLEFERYYPDSFWAPYLAVIPPPPSPITWTESEISEIQSQTVCDFIRQQKNWLNQTYLSLLPYLAQKYPSKFNLSKNTLESFVESAVTAWTRSFNVKPPKSSTTESVLIPVADMINHKRGIANTYQQIEWLHVSNDSNDGSQGVFHFLAPEAKRQGEEILITYSEVRPTLNWVVWAGFVPESVFGDYVTVQAVVPTALLKSVENFRGVVENCEGICGSRPTVALVTWISNDGWVDEDFVRWFSNFSGKSIPSVFQWIAHHASSFLSSLPTSLEQDKEELAKLLSNKQASRATVAIHTRVRMKQIVTALVNKSHSRALDEEGKLRAAHTNRDVLATHFVFESKGGDPTGWSVGDKVTHALAVVDLDWNVLSA